MAYGCAYSIDQGVPCQNWKRTEDEYCSAHEHSIDEINKFWREVNLVIQKALEDKP